LFDIKDIDGRITVGTEGTRATKVESLKGHVIQLVESSIDVILQEVKYVPELLVFFQYHQGI
jgi:hypothetical protein